MTVEERLARLEKQNRWMKVLLVMLMLALVTLSVAAAEYVLRAEEVPDEVTAKKLTIVDEKGEGWGLRAELSSSGLSLFREGQKLTRLPTLAALISVEHGLVFYDENCKVIFQAP